MISNLQQQVQPRTFGLMLMSIWLLTLIAAYLYIFKNPLSMYLQERRIVDRIDHSPISLDSLSENIEATQKQIDRYREKLNPDESKVSANLLVARVIGKLDQIAKQQSVQLIRVEPRQIKSVLIFEEMPFIIEIEGSYLSLFKWLHAVRKNLQLMVVKGFEIRRSEKEDSRHMWLTLAFYRLKQ